VIVETAKAAVRQVVIVALFGHELAIICHLQVFLAFDNWHCLRKIERSLAEAAAPVGHFERLSKGKKKWSFMPARRARADSITDAALMLFASQSAYPCLRYIYAAQAFVPSSQVPRSRSVRRRILQAPRTLL